MCLWVCVYVCFFPHEWCREICKKGPGGMRRHSFRLPLCTLIHTHTSSFRRMTARFYGWLDYVRKHCRALIVGKPRLRRIIIPFAPPLFSNFVWRGMKQEEEDGGKGQCMWGEVGRVNDAANTRARWDRTPKQLRVTVIMQAKLPSMVYVHVCVCAV